MNLARGFMGFSYFLKLDFWDGVDFLLPKVISSNSLFPNIFNCL